MWKAHFCTPLRLMLAYWHVGLCGDKHLVCTRSQKREILGEKKEQKMQLKWLQHNAASVITMKVALLCPQHTSAKSLTHVKAVSSGRRSL